MEYGFDSIRFELPTYIKFFSDLMNLWNLYMFIYLKASQHPIQLKSSLLKLVVVYQDTIKVEYQKKI